MAWVPEEEFEQYISDPKRHRADAANSQNNPLSMGELAEESFDASEINVRNVDCFNCSSNKHIPVTFRRRDSYRTSGTLAFAGYLDVVENARGSKPGTFRLAHNPPDGLSECGLPEPGVLFDDEGRESSTRLRVKT